MKISWGFKVTALYSGFVLMIVSMVVLSSFSRTDLEREDYYEEELKHDEKMTAIANMTALDAEIRIVNEGNEVYIQYPDAFNQKKSSVELWVYSPNNSGNDKRFKFNCNGAFQNLNTKDWTRGTYSLRFNVNDGIKKYYFEKEINLK